MRVPEKGDNVAVTVTDSPEVHPSDDPYAELVRASARGDAEALEALLMRAQQVAYRFSLLVCGHPEDAEDVMQDALIRTYQHVGTIKDPGAFRTWLFRTVRNACLMKRRRRVQEPVRMEAVEPDSASDVASHDRGPDDLAINAWLGRTLREALAKLPPAYRMVVLLREMEGLSTREVAEVTGLTEDNVKTRLHRARTMLRESLESVR